MSRDLAIAVVFVDVLYPIPSLFCVQIHALPGFQSVFAVSHSIFFEIFLDSL